jgi:hypothetical protein
MTTLGTLMWYYQLNNQPVGPSDQETIQDLLTQRILTRNTLVWKEGMSEWGRVDDTELAPFIPTNVPPPLSPPALPPSSAGFGGPRTLRSIWLSSAVLMGASAALVFFGFLALAVSDVLGGLVLFLGSMTGVGGAGLWLLLLYKGWSAIQDTNLPTTPGKAVGFLFIPGFCLYWQFVAIVQLAKHINRYAADRSVAITPINEQLALTLCIAYCTVAIPVVNFLTIPGCMLISIILGKSIADATAAIIASKAKANVSPNSALTASRALCARTEVAVP